MPKIIKNGVVYTPTATELTTGSSTIGAESGHLELSSGYTRGDGATGELISGTYKIYSGTSVPLASFGQDGDIYLVKVS